jgi:hypothetical protein
LARLSPDALAKKKRVSRDALIGRGLKALLAAEGEEEVVGEKRKNWRSRYS